MLFSPWNVSSLNECPRLCECWKKSHYCGNVWIAPLSLRLSFGAFISLFFWDFLWHISVEAFPLWARRCDAWYSCQCFWCTPCNRWSWDSITLSASWGNIFAAPQILTWYAAVLNCKDLPALHGVRKPLCACRYEQCTCRPDLKISAHALILFYSSASFLTDEACPCVRHRLFVFFHLRGSPAAANHHQRKKDWS